ncbi:MAG: hypothetical protein R8G34_09100 [Paracoccaceae bacterium]|nr:hypothetical protein [Paracoccaceae bacterium]
MSIHVLGQAAALRTMSRGIGNRILAGRSDWYVFWLDPRIETENENLI